MSKFPLNNHKNPDALQTQRTTQHNSYSTAQNTARSTTPVQIHSSTPKGKARRHSEAFTMKVIFVSSIVLIFFLIMNILTLASTIMRDQFQYNTIDEDMILYALRDGDYEYLADRYQRADEKERHKTETIAEGYAVASYYNNAVLYKAYTTVGDTGEAAVYHAEMAENIEDMGVFFYNAALIDEVLAIEPGFSS